MKKYDCSKTADFAHEAKRMCESYVEKTGQCIKCPLYATECDIDNITDRVIDVVQKWSDENPEKPKLSKKEYEFLTNFRIENASLCRDRAIGCALYIPSMDFFIGLDNRMFKFISNGEYWPFKSLLELEVEDE